MGWPETQAFAPLGPVEVSCVPNTNHLCLVKSKGEWGSMGLLGLPGPDCLVAARLPMDAALTHGVSGVAMARTIGGIPIPVQAPTISTDRHGIHTVNRPFRDHNAVWWGRR
jgi:hypothetical protein